MVTENCASFINLSRQTEAHHLSWHKIKEEMKKVQKKKKVLFKRTTDGIS